MAEEKETSENSNEAKPKKSKSLFIIIGIIVVILGAGGFFGWNFFMKGEKGDEAETSKSDSKKEQVNIVYPLKSFIVNLMGKSRLSNRYLKVIIQLEIGSEEQKQRFLPRIARGEINLTMALTEPNSWYNVDSIGVKAIRDKNEYVINGVKLFVPYAHIADFIICAAKTKEEAPDGEGFSLFIVDKESPGITCNVLKTIAMDKQCEVIFENTRVPKESILGELDHGWASMEKLLQEATVALCAQMVGGAQQVLDMTVDYAKQRVLFGRPMGSFQMIQSHCVEMLAMLEDSRLLTYEAGWKLSQGLPCAKEVAMAKARASQAYQTITTLGHQIHGGVGYAVEHDMGLYFRRAKSAEVSFGDADFHLEKIAIELGL